MQFAFMIFLFLGISFLSANAQELKIIVPIKMKVLGKHEQKYSQRTSKNMIEGRCLSKAGDCEGATISLYKNKKIMTSGTLTKKGIFKFSGLRKGLYDVGIKIKRYNINKYRRVKRGEFLQINLGPGRIRATLR